MSHSDSEDDDGQQTPSTQLLAALQSSITAALSTHRPLLTHLNADTTWLLSLPAPKSQRRKYFHIILDPWLKGGQADVARFFSQQWHNEESCAQSISDVENIIRGIEDAARGKQEEEEEDWDMEGGDGDGDGEQQHSGIDAVIISHEFTDHMHRETLLEIHPSVPVYATYKAAGIMRSWAHFTTVLDIPKFTGDWRTSSAAPLPSWIGVSRVAYDGLDLLYYHSAVMVTFQLQGDSGAAPDGGAEAVIYTPHGIDPANLTLLPGANPPIRTLALLHGLHDIQIKNTWPIGVKAQLNKGAHNGLKVQRMLGAKYWISTHDEVKKGGGIVSWFLERQAISLEEALEVEKVAMEGEEGEDEDDEEDEEDDEGTLVELGDVRFEEVGNGQCLVLE